MKPMVRMGIGVALTLATVVWAGLFQYCTRMADSESINEYCEFNDDLECEGFCIKYVVKNRYQCENSISPWCGGVSYATVYEYHGTCVGDVITDCWCDFPPQTPVVWGFPNECD